MLLGRLIASLAESFFHIYFCLSQNNTSQPVKKQGKYNADSNRRLISNIDDASKMTIHNHKPNLNNRIPTSLRPMDPKNLQSLIRQSNHTLPVLPTSLLRIQHL